MKKLLAIALIAATFTACNDSETKTEETTIGSDTATQTITTPDTATQTVVTDTTVTTTTTTTDVADTTKKN